MRVTLPGGWWDDGGRLHRAAELGVLTGRDEEALTGVAAAATPRAVTEVLARCLHRLGDLQPVPPAVVRELLVGDREWLLLQLRRATFGDLVRGDLMCPWPSCGKRVTLEFSAGDVPVRTAPDPRPWYELPLPGSSVVRFRLPTGGDAEELGPLAVRDPGSAATLLLARCIGRIGEVADPGPEVVADLPADDRWRIESEMERLAPAVDREVDTPCPECGRTFTVTFDIHQYVFGELRTNVSTLYREVHQLASHYHWSEAEIMGMPRDRRETYLDVLAGELERLNDGA
ncbi:T4 family baseplate hub assembly chaperone [Paractinoplanes durhamensis]|uniref:T4 bacteriophage base plate protein n=1 Tax=Paractinoplanes durhamensis TaxID=113563 RepID=A0ABQ3Z794_9ACTN|nr:hypothetical protein [Actinoplanes durhamensis]GIE05674.1 hypothetical protein Adu01nite_70240 [Actinoplanes durhamensis]